MRSNRRGSRLNQKILLVAHQLDRSGAPIALLNLALSLQKLGYITFIATLKNGPLGAEFLQHGTKAFNPALHTHLDFDLIISNTIVTLPWSLTFASSKTKVVGYIHESVEMLEFMGTTKAFLEAHKPDAAIFPAEFQLEQFSDLSIKESYVLPNTISNEFKMQESALTLVNRPFFVVVGPWHPRKGQKKLVELTERYFLRPKIVFIGADPAYNEWKDQFIFTGEVSNDLSRSLISCSVGLLSFSSAEVQPISVLESLQGSTPCLLSDIPAHVELAKQTSMIRIFNETIDNSFLNGYQWLLERSFADARKGSATEGLPSKFTQTAYESKISAIVRSLFCNS